MRTAELGLVLVWFWDLYLFFFFFFFFFVGLPQISVAMGAHCAHPSAHTQFLCW